MSKRDEEMGEKNIVLLERVREFFADEEDSGEIDEVVVFAVDRKGVISMLSNVKDVLHMLNVVDAGHDMILELRRQTLLSKNSIMDEDFAKDGEFNSNGDPSIGVAGSEGIAPGSGGRSRLN